MLTLPAERGYWKCCTYVSDKSDKKQTSYQPSDDEHPSPCKAAGCVGTGDTSSTEIQLFTHHDIVKQYRKGLKAIVDRCVVYTYPTIGTTVCSEKFYSLLFCSGRDSCMLTSRCMLPWLRSAPYPALCPCEPLGPVGDMQAVSYVARSRQYSPLLPASSS